MTENERFLGVLRAVDARPEMYLQGGTSTELSAFITGLECGFSPSPLRGFGEWLFRKWAFYSQRHWSCHLDEIYRLHSLKAATGDLVTFTISQIEDYLSSVDTVDLQYDPAAPVG